MFPELHSNLTYRLIKCEQFLKNSSRESVKERALQTKTLSQIRSARYKKNTNGTRRYCFKRI